MISLIPRREDRRLFRWPCSSNCVSHLGTKSWKKSSTSQNSSARLKVCSLIYFVRVMFGNTISSQSSNQGVIFSMIPYPEFRLIRLKSIKSAFWNNRRTRRIDSIEGQASIFSLSAILTKHNQRQRELAMTRARKHLVCIKGIPYYHITSRFIRCYFLCGYDHQTRHHL